jgi:3-hydroxybutyryl-CoA dehydrogenase
MKLETIGVVGLGLLGRGIATCLLSRGFRVIALDPSEKARQDAAAHIADGIDDLVAHGVSPASLRETWRARYVEASGPGELAGCDFVIESVVEDLDAKRRLFDEIETAVGPATPVASNTSSLPISVLQSGRRHPQRFVGMHWAEPCHLTRFLEVIRGKQTDDAAADAALALGRACGKEPSLVRKDVEGFIVNRIGYAMYREALHLLGTGVADVETIDRAFSNSVGLWAGVAGPFRWMDLTGLSAYAAVMERLFPQLDDAAEVPRPMRELVDGGARGISNLRGFYPYTPEEAERWRRLLVEHVWAVRGMTDRYFPLGNPSDQEVTRHE